MRNKECEIFFYDDLIPNQIVIETIQDMECLSSFDFVKSVRETRTGHLLQSNHSVTTLKMYPSLEEDAELLHKENYYGFGTKIAVLDAGINKEYFSHIHNEKDFTGHGSTPITYHGNVVVSIIKKFAPGAGIYSGKICNSVDDLKEENLLSALQWAAREEKVNVINLSAGFNSGCKGNCMLANYINAIVQKLKIIIVVAVGNREKATTFCPACAQEAISVGSLSKDGNSVADFSTPGSIHLSKPNVVAQGHGGIFFPDGPIPFEGTSFAAPVVSGIITALVLNNPSSATLISNFYMATEYLDNTPGKKQGLGKVSLPKLMEVLENAQKIHPTGTEN
ncbi:S8 family peptidase [Bacillus paranthracis]|uniref:S8 family peptidase n=1 Tax=Bacillus paranthracis TaxID=2026186 RepID=UPI002407A02C|nr:S8/S53 family peptidase [Bacillus paranthracis]